MTRLPTPDFDDAGPWVRRHLGHLAVGAPLDAPARRGGQTDATAALAALDVTGYAKRRSMVDPPSARAASVLSPYIRYGLVDLAAAMQAASGPDGDVRRFRDELLWQEYARHLYARAGAHGRSIDRRQPAVADEPWNDPMPSDMECLRAVRDELHATGWLVNQTRMWVASQWTVRAGHPWLDGEDMMFRHLLDGSRAANRFGWAWTVGAMTSKSYGFSRWQVERRAPSWCARCSLRNSCPIDEWPDAKPGPAHDHAWMKSGSDLAGPSTADCRSRPDVVWLTAESLGDADLALVANPDLPVVFVFDETLLARLQLSAGRLVFLAETLADLARRRHLEVHLGAPATVVAEHDVAVTYAPVPGFQRIVSGLVPAEVHPYRWLSRPDGGDVRSYSSWIRRHRHRVA